MYCNNVKLKFYHLNFLGIHFVITVLTFAAGSMCVCVCVYVCVCVCLCVLVYFLSNEIVLIGFVHFFDILLEQRLEDVFHLRQISNIIQNGPSYYN